MANELKQIHLDMIPEFRGEQNLVHRFIDISSKLINKFFDIANPENFQNELLLCNIISKIKSPAAEQISSYKVTNFEELKSALLATYSDKRDIYTLTLEISRLKQGPSETCFHFVDRLQKLLNFQLAQISSFNETESSNTLCNFAKNLSLRVLLQGLREPVGSLMRTRNPPDLATAVSLLTNDFQYYNSNPSLPSNTISRPNLIAPSRNNSQTPHHNIHNRTSNTITSFRPPFTSTNSRNPNNISRINTSNPRNPNNSFAPQNLTFYSPVSPTTSNANNVGNRYISTPDRSNRNRENLHQVVNDAIVNQPEIDLESKEQYIENPQNNYEPFYPEHYDNFESDLEEYSNKNNPEDNFLDEVSTSRDAT